MHSVYIRSWNGCRENEVCMRNGDKAGSGNMHSCAMQISTAPSRGTSGSFTIVSYCSLCAQSIQLQHRHHQNRAVAVRKVVSLSQRLKDWDVKIIGPKSALLEPAHVEKPRVRFKEQGCARKQSKLFPLVAQTF